MRIGIDIDDTITNSTQLVDRCMKKYSHLYCDDDELINRKAELLRGTFQSDVVKQFFKDHSIEISDQITVKKDARSIIKKLHKEGHEIIIITARSDNYYIDAQAYCEKFLKDRNIYYDKLITRQTYKDKTCRNEHIDLMIDDAVDTCESVNKYGIKSLLFTSELNKDKTTSVPRVNTWKEVYNYIHNL